MQFTSEEREFLESLISTPSPVGYEAAGQRVWLEHIREASDEVITDLYGSAAAKISINEKAPTVMLEAHCDEIGMVVQYIGDKGFIYINRIGGSDPTIARARRVNIHTRKGIVSGIIGHVAIHLQNRDNQKSPSWKDLFIDIGVSSREEAQELVQVGDPITYADDFEFISEDLLAGRAIDNRIGGFIIAHAFKKLAAEKEKLNVNVVALNAVQEEVGGHGARMMAYRLNADMALVTDVTHATDSPGINPKEHGLVKLGGGPVVSHGGANQVKLVEKVVSAAEKADITIQHEATSGRTGTDTDVIFYAKSGIASTLISTPMRYMHTPHEMVSMEDVWNLSRLMQETVKSLSRGENLMPV